MYIYIYKNVYICIYIKVLCTYIKLTNLVFPSSEKRQGEQSLNRENVLIKDRVFFLSAVGQV